MLSFIHKIFFLKRLVPAIITGTCLYSCTYDHTDNVPCNTSVPDTISFHENILPLFSADCSTAGCHSGGSPSGNLSLEDSIAYTQLMRSGSGYINTVTPNFSLLYSQMISTNDPMPPSGKLSDCQIELVLKWIQQGAKNN